MSGILLIDDDPTLTHLLSMHLTKQNFAVDIAYTIDSALEYAQKNNYDLILQDVYYPNKEDGLKVMEQYYPFVSAKHIPIVLMTAMPMDLLSMQDNFEKYLSMAQLFISKSDDLKQIVDRVLEIIAEKNQPA